LDIRVNAIRDDLADATLAGQLVSTRYADPVRLRCIVDTAPVVNAPDVDAVAVSALLAGEDFDAFELIHGWAWGRCVHDAYVGWVPRAALGAASDSVTHRITAAVAPIFSGPDIKRSVVGRRYLGSRLAAEVTGDFVALHGGGFVHRRHVDPVAVIAADWTAVARRLIGAPYVWGGRALSGIDCSGLVQVAMAACGIAVPRDCDQQRAALLKASGTVPERGNLVFFPGHVGIMVDGEQLLHANAYWMTTLIEPLAAVVARLRPHHAVPIIGVARPADNLSLASTTCLPAVGSL